MAAIHRLCVNSQLSVLSEITTTVRPLRPKVLVDASSEHLKTHQYVAYLCFLRTLRHYAMVLEKMDLMNEIPWGKFWCHHVQKGADQLPLCLKASSLANIVKKKLAAANIQTAEETETDRGDDTPQRLAGHFLRGHAGSIAYDFACDGATWAMDEGINRARHTLKVFFKSYYRRTNNRQRLAFAVAKSKGKQLRFEEALVL